MIINRIPELISYLRFKRIRWVLYDLSGVVSLLDTIKDIKT